MIKPLLVLTFSFNVAMANTGTELLLKQKSELNLKSNYSKVVPTLKLDDTFLVQSYGALRAIRTNNIEIQDFYNAIFNKSFENALALHGKIKTTNKEEKKLVAAGKLYTLWKLKLNQSFFDTWVEEVSSYDFFNSELGVALDQIVSVDASTWLIRQGIFISEEQKKKIDSVANGKAKFNYSVQAYRNLRKGEAGLKWIPFLKVKDPLRVKLADSAILDLAIKGRLGDSAKIVKEVIEPALTDVSNTETIANYYLTLGRLLYQAKAYEASKAYYMMIPDESKKFLQARTEALWISMRNNDHSVILGELRSLELNMFKKHFNPEVFLVSSMANLQLCQFSDVEKSFNEFIKVNKKHAKMIEENLVSQKPAIADKDNFFVKLILNYEKNLKQEKSKLENLNEKALIANLSSVSDEVEARKNFEIKRDWSNRKKLVEITLRRMRFVKIEFLSKMRRLKGKLANLNQNQDKVSTYTSAIDKTDKLEFPHDGVIFGDELFHFRSKIKNLCLQGKR